MVSLAQDTAAPAIKAPIVKPPLVKPKIGRDDWMMRAFMGVIGLYLVVTLAFPLYVMMSKSFTAYVFDLGLIEFQVDEGAGWGSTLKAHDLAQTLGLDLIEENIFKPLRAFEAGHHGPYRLRLSVKDGRLALEIFDEAGSELEILILGLGRFRRPIREYFAICESYYQAIRKATAKEIETIDMARRGVHNEAAEMLLERLDGKVETDFDTARRLFTLICVLHIRG